jgi:hypothetical protein
MVDKSAQQTDVGNLDLSEILMPMTQDRFPGVEVDGDIEVTDEEPDEIVFHLDEIPGAPDAKEIVVQDDNSAAVEVDEDPEKSDEWTPKTFLPWLEKKFSDVPAHSGYDTTGLEKAISHFERLDREITKAMRTDFKNEIDSAKAERAREQIENGMERLIDRLDKVQSSKYKRKAKKSKSWAETTGLVKEAQKATNITGITITVPLLISRIARVCINGMVSAGHDIEDMFKRQVDEYSLDKREQAELSQLLSDMGYPMLQDRGYPVGEPVQIWRSDNFDWNAQYRG